MEEKIKLSRWSILPHSSIFPPVFPFYVYRSVGMYINIRKNVFVILNYLRNTNKPSKKEDSPGWLRNIGSLPRVASASRNFPSFCHSPYQPSVQSFLLVYIQSLGPTSRHDGNASQIHRRAILHNIPMILFVQRKKITQVSLALYSFSRLAENSVTIFVLLDESCCFWKLSLIFDFSTIGF